MVASEFFYNETRSRPPKMFFKKIVYRITNVQFVWVLSSKLTHNILLEKHPEGTPSEVYCNV